MMTLEEAIEHAEDIAISANGCECREEHRQLADINRAKMILDVFGDSLGRME